MCRLINCGDYIEFCFLTVFLNSRLSCLRFSKIILLEDDDENSWVGSMLPDDNSSGPKPQSKKQAFLVGELKTLTPSPWTTLTDYPNGLP